MIAAFFFAEKEIPTPKDYDEILKAIVGLRDQVAEAHGYEGPVGICTPGSISKSSGLMQGSNSQSLNGRNLQADLAGGS